MVILIIFMVMVAASALVGAALMLSSQISTRQETNKYVSSDSDANTSSPAPEC